MPQSTIEWTETTWNSTTGCTKVSEGCRHCYAEVMAKRLHAMGVEKYKDGFQVRMHPDVLKLPYKWKKPKVVFVNSMSDLFHEKIPLDFIQKAFNVMNNNPHHVFQVLTKRAERLLELNNKLNWPHNIWMGVTVENSDVEHRIKLLKQTNARIKFLSLEPLLGPLPNLNLAGIDWVIVGGESGQNARPMKAEWVVDIQQQCQKNGVAFYFKQWGGRNRKKNGRELFGKTFDEMPPLEVF